jgi:hypothetical protein
VLLLSHAGFVAIVRRFAAEFAAAANNGAAAEGSEPLDAQGLFELWPNSRKNISLLSNLLINHGCTVCVRSLFVNLRYL